MKEFLIQRYRQDPLGPAIPPTLVQIDDTGRVIRADRHTDTMFGYEPAELIGKPVQQILASRQDDPFAPANRHRLNDGQKVLVTFRHKEGFFFTARLGLHTEMRDSDQAASAAITLRDSIAMDSSLLTLAEQSAGFGLWELDIASNEIGWTEGVYRLLELQPGTELTPEQALFYCQAGQNRVRALFRRSIRTGKPFRIDLSILTGKQNPQTVTLAGGPIGNSREPQRLGGVIVNHSEAMRHDDEKQRVQSILEATSNATEDLVLAVNTRLDLLHFNKPWARQFYKVFGLAPSV
ncbi:MAG TPA: GGDEF domain-containing protein, partial [Marinobacter sp.]|nr:GGDEF domain-containing protein [Marinobacter sp.]